MLFVVYIFLLAQFVLANETVLDAARLARQLVGFGDAIGTLATVYPHDHPTLAHQPFALMEYYAPCYTNGSLSILFLPISQNNRNILRSPSHFASLTVHSTPAKASGARVALMGNMVILREGVTDEIVKCYIKLHPDAKWWVPERKDGPHLAYWARFDPHTIYYVGGFGDEHYIGNIPLDLYRKGGEIGAEYQFTAQE